MVLARVPLALLVAAALVGCARPHLVVLDYGSNVSDAEWASEACQRPVSVLAAGDSAALQFLRTYVGACSPAGNPSLARALQDHRSTTDTSVMAEVTYRTYEVIDSALFEAAQGIAADSSASVVARVFALRTLFYTFKPGHFRSFEQMTSPEQACRGLGPHNHWHISLGAPLPVDFRERTRRLSANLITDRTVPPAVQQAAYCTGHAAAEHAR